MLDTNQVFAVHAIPAMIQEEDVVCSIPNCDTGLTVITNNTNSSNSTTSRPSSQLSQNGSSGYGSTRSHVGPYGTSNRPSPSASSSTSSSSADKPKSGSNPNKPKRSVWFGSLRGRATSAEPVPDITEVAASQIRGPQYASLRIPNRIRHHSSHGDLPSYEDRGLDLVEAEVDSDPEVPPPVPAPRGSSVASPPPPCYSNYPIRHASSLEAQVRFF
jgi:hypothetical protein